MTAAGPFPPQAAPSPSGGPELPELRARTAHGAAGRPPAEEERAEVGWQQKLFSQVGARCGPCRLPAAALPGLCGPSGRFPSPRCFSLIAFPKPRPAPECLRDRRPVCADRACAGSVNLWALPVSKKWLELTPL